MQEDKHQVGSPVFSTGFIDVPGGQLYYEASGKGHPFILSQGRNALDRRLWDQQFTVFAQSFQVVRYDVRGCGKSPNSTTSYTQADDLAQLYHALKVEKSYLLDLSGGIALNFLHTYQPFVDALIIVSPGISPAPSSADAMAQLPGVLERYASLAEAVQQHDTQRAIDEVMQMWGLPSSSFLKTYHYLRTMIADNLPAFFTRTAIADTQAFDTRDQWLKELQIPVLLLVGEYALPEIRASAQALERIIPNVQRQTIPHTHFLLNLEQPEVFEHTIFSFLQTLPE